ncbi:hypothetical protein [Streptomyces sp. bgisy034]|uniref:hypothetical protein n=1 Tax=Streptomyces sp. bgisy034 TaxID=3413774 RepID=UPI003EBFAB67
MAQNSWPSPNYNSRNVTDLEYEKLAAEFSDDGVYGDPTDAAVVTPGVGLSVDIRADVYASVRGHAWSSGSTGDTLAISANASGQTRVDRVVLRLDRSTWDVRAVVREGTPGAGVPTISTTTGDTGYYEVLVANVTILDGAGTVTVTRGERYVGSRLRPTLSTALINPNPKLGDLLYEVDTGRIRLYDGSSLRTIYSASGQLVVNSPLSAWANNGESVIEERNGVVALRTGAFERTAGTLGGATESRLPVFIPATYRHPNRYQYATVYITGLNVGRMTIYPSNDARAGQIWLTQHPDMATGSSVSATSTSWVVN